MDQVKDIYKTNLRIISQKMMEKIMPPSIMKLEDKIQQILWLKNQIQHWTKENRTKMLLF